MSTDFLGSPRDPRIKDIKVVDATFDPASGDSKVLVTLEYKPETEEEKKFSMMALDQLFNCDAVKRLAIESAQQKLYRQAGWSDVGRLTYYSGDDPANPGDQNITSVRCVIKCSATL